MKNPPLNPEELEEVLYIQRRIRAGLALEKIWDEAVQKGLNRMTPQEIDRIIKETRRARKGRTKK